MGGAFRLLLPGFLLAVLAIVTAPGPEDASGAEERRNILVVMTDDQDVRSIEVMEAVQRRLAAQGVTYVNAFATTPTCCPSRATFLTGQYAHNTGVHSTDPESRDKFDHSRTLPVALDRAGYRTGFIGKYNLAGETAPPGWDLWRGLTTDPTEMFDYTLSHNGELRHHDEYQTDLFGQMAERFVTRTPEPFFLWVATAAPHKPSQPAPRHADVHTGAPLPEPPNFNEEDVGDKPQFVRDAPRITKVRRDYLTEEHRDRLGTLLAVDEMVDGLLDALRSSHRLADTVVVFTSDNGYLLGEHRLYGKVRLYEESAHVPLIVRGAGFPTGATRQGVAGNIDLAPTVLDIADAEPAVEPDGQSLLEPLDDRDLLLEAWPVPRKGWLETSVGLRTRDHAYIEHDTGEQELYDLDTDPFQLESLHDDPEHAGTEASLDLRLEALRDCAGTSCR
jgi:arylsulfatase A-like enzyme